MPDLNAIAEVNAPVVAFANTGSPIASAVE